MSRLVELFDDAHAVQEIKRKLPYLFQLAELESSRAGKIGMEVGSAREKIIVALLIYKFGEESVKTDPITKSEVDVRLFGEPISVKTITGESLTGVKLSWTVDAEKARGFSENYSPSCDIIFVQILWGGQGGFFFIPLEIQRKLFGEVGRERYIKLPKAGTNPRGVEITAEALSALVSSNGTRSISVDWQRAKIEYDPYKRWVDYWREAI